MFLRYSRRARRHNNAKIVTPCRSPFCPILTVYYNNIFPTRQQDRRKYYFSISAEVFEVDFFSESLLHHNSVRLSVAHHPKRPSTISEPHTIYTKNSV